MKEPAADLAIVGGGVSSLAILEPLLTELVNIRPSGQPWRITIFDSRSRFGRGVAYATDVPAGCLCNDPLPKQGGPRFLAWVREQQAVWTSRLAATRDPLALAWLCRHGPAVTAGPERPERLTGLFLPRVTYGDFLEQSVAAAKARAAASGCALQFLGLTVLGLMRAEDGLLRLQLAGGGSVPARLAVLATGSPPPGPEPALATHAGYLTSASLVGLGIWIEDRVGRAGHDTIAILGGNAAAMEALHLIHADLVLKTHLRRILLVTRRGSLPDAAASGRLGVPTMPRLGALAGSEPTADRAFAAALADIAAARAAGHTSLDWADPLQAAFQPLLAHLDLAGRRRFVERYGRSFKGLTRHTPAEYAESARRLQEAGLLEIVASEVAELTAHGADALCVRWMGGEAVVAGAIDARGWGGLQTARDPLLRSLLDGEGGGPALVRCNGSGIGLVVDEAFQASRGLFVLGPLLAGVANARHTFWNLENSARLMALGPVLARTLAQQMRRGCCGPV